MGVGLPDPGASRAVLIGASGFATLDALPAVAGNLSALGDLLTSGLWGLPDRHCRTVADPASPLEVSRAVREAAEQATDALLVYYAGHGLIDPGSGELHLAVPASDPRSVYDTAVPYGWIRRAMERSRAGRRIVVLDCCYSARAFGAQSADMADLAEADGTYVLAAAAETAVALAPPGETHTAFTGELVTLLGNGIPGEPELLSLDVVFARLRSALAAKERPEPQSLCRNQVGSLPFARNAAFVAGAGAPRPVRPVEALAGLRAAQRRAAREAPYRLYGPRRPELGQIYVRRGLSGAAGVVGAEADGWAGGLSAGGVRTVAGALAEHEHLLIVAGPGLGKSTLTLQLAAEPPGDEDGRGERLLPLRVSARELAARRRLPWARAVAEAASAELGQHLDGVLPAELVAEPVDGARWLLLVDGLDEVPDPVVRGELAEVLAGRMELLGGPHRLVVTTRPLGRAESDRLLGGSVGRFTVDPFDRESLERFARGWFAHPPSKDSEELASRFLAQISEAELTAVVRVPLLATVAAAVFEQEPDRLLPHSRRELYDEFLGYLNSRWGERNWRLLRERVADVDGGPRALDVLRDKRGELVRRLARVRLEGDEPLLSAALAWAGANAAVPQGPLSQWREVVATVLTGTAPLLRDGGDVSFVHQSFADHLAAEAYADELPVPFDIADPGWRRWVQAALARRAGAEPAKAVLLAHLIRRPGSGLAAWLLEQTDDSRLLFCQLVASGAPVGPGEREAVLACGHRWLTRSESSHPALPSLGAQTLRWLIQWRSREAMELLLRVATGRSEDSDSRVYVNQLLIGLGDPWREDAIRRLREVMLDRTVDAYRRYRVASDLAEDDESSGELCVTVLMELVTDDSVAERVRLSAARPLMRMAPDRWDVVAGIMRAIIAGSSATASRVQAALMLVEWDPGCRPEAAACLRGEASSTDPARSGWEAVGAAGALVRLGPGYDEEGLALLRDWAGERQPARVRVLAARELRSLGGHDEEAEGVLLAVARSCGEGVKDRADVAYRLLGGADRHQTEGIRLVRELMAECPAAEMSVILGVVKLLSVAPRYRDEAADALRRWIAVSDLGRATGFAPGWLPYDVDYALQTLASIGPEHAAEAARIVRSALRECDDVLALPRLAGLLAELGGEYLTEGIGLLRAMSRDPDTSSTLGWAAGRQLEMLGVDPGDDAPPLWPGYAPPEPSSS